VCFWEDDGAQLLDPSYRGGANGPSLMECQANYARLGASEERFLGNVRLPDDDDAVDPDWRPAQESDLRRARVPKDLSDDEYSSAEAWYYWKAT
jgi:hypothetical protein